MSLESGSTSSLNYHRDLSQDDGTSTTSGHSSVDLQQSLDDSERLTMLASAVTWIKQELVSKSYTLIKLGCALMHNTLCISSNNTLATEY